MTAWGKYTEVDMLPVITEADPDMIYVLPDETDWISSKNWCSDGDIPVWRPFLWAFGIPCERCGGTGACETELHEGLVYCPACRPDERYVS